MRVFIAAAVAALCIAAAIAAGIIIGLHAQDSSRQQGLAIEHRICLTLARLAALRPPAGDPATNPSRAYDQAQHATLDQLGPDLGCR